MARCSSCGAALLWVTSAATGKTMPIDAIPVADGNVVIDGGKAFVIGPIERPKLPPETLRYRSHFSTCPHAGHWRARKERARG